MIGFRPRDFEFGQQMLNITRSTVYVIARYHPSGKAGWLTKPHPKNGDWRRFTISKRAVKGQLSKANTWRRDGTEFLMADVGTRFWNAARDSAGLPEAFTPYNARHTGISWAIDKGVDLQKVRQRAGHGSLEVTSRYAAILDKRDTSLADALEEIFDHSRPSVGRHQNAKSSIMRSTSLKSTLSSATDHGGSRQAVWATIKICPERSRARHDGHCM
jgi:integrase